MNTTTNAGDFDRYFAQAFAEHLIGAGPITEETVKARFEETRAALGGRPLPSDKLYIADMTQQLMSQADTFKGKSREELIRAIFSLLYVK